MSERVFWFTCLYAFGDYCIRVVDDTLDEDRSDPSLFTSKGKRVPNKLYDKPSDVPETRIRLLGYTEIGFDNHTVYEACQQGFFYDTERDDPEEVRRVKSRVAKAVAARVVKVLDEQKRRLSRMSAKLLKDVERTGLENE